MPQIMPSLFTRFGLSTQTAQAWLAPLRQVSASNRKSWPQAAGGWGVHIPPASCASQSRENTINGEMHQVRRTRGHDLRILHGQTQPDGDDGSSRHHRTG